MNTKHIVMKHLKLFVGTTIYWITAFFGYVLFRYVGISDIPGITIEQAFDWYIIIELVLVMGVFTGVLYSLIEILFEHNWMRRKAIGIKVVSKFLVYFFILSIDIELGMNVVAGIYKNPHLMSPEEISTMGGVWSFISYFLICSVLFSFIKIINEKFGPGVFWKMLIGKYNPPRVERKIFMFLDLKSSTTHAEHLGFHKYSEFIQNCFYDLNEVITLYSGEIYQYVGDEAIISWDFDKGVNENDCIDLYFSFREKLISKEEFYIENYGILPEFKAGLHGGELMVAEIGVVKKELAYHGDVINTTARIQDMCNSLKEYLLISDDLLSFLKLGNEYSQNSKGEFTLRGKEDSISIHGIRKK